MPPFLRQGGGSNRFYFYSLLPALFHQMKLHYDHIGDQSYDTFPGSSGAQSPDVKAEREDVNKPRIVIQLMPVEQSFQKLLGDLLAFHTLAYSEVMIF